jgi:hypothetical protein
VKFLEHVAPLLDLQGGAPRVKTLMSEYQRLERFLETETAELVRLHSYVADERLGDGLPQPLEKARLKLLAFMDEGERAIAEPATLRRLGQSFLAAYRRQYLAWHMRVHHGKQFDAYRLLQESPTFRALTVMGEAGLEVQNSAERLRPLLASQIAAQCTEDNLEAALAEQPVCPSCGLRSGQFPDVQPPERIMDLMEEGLAEYARALRSRDRQQAIIECASGLVGRSELQARLQRLANLPDHPTPRELLMLLEGDVVGHLRRALSGRTLRPRRLEDLAALVGGKTLSKTEFLAHVEQWLEAEEGLGTDEMLRIE